MIASVAAGPVPLNRVKPGKLSEVYLPSAYAALDPYGIPLGAYHQHQFLDAYPVKQIPVQTVDATNQQVQLLLSVPAVVPLGTSVTVTVQVANTQSGSAPTVTIGTPQVIVTNPGGKPSNPSTVNDDVIIVDADSGSGINFFFSIYFKDILKITCWNCLGPSVIDALGSVDDLDNREPPLLALLPFDNPKDSPLLVALQEQAIKQEMLAALVNRKF